MPGKTDWVTIVPAEDDGQEAMAADHNEAWSVKRMDSAAAISVATVATEVFDVDNIGIAATTDAGTIGGGGLNINAAHWPETWKKV